MAERHDRCRFWPHCSIHLGMPRPKNLTDANYAEIRELYFKDKLSQSQIAEIFGIWRSAVWQILAQKHQPRRTTGLRSVTGSKGSAG